MKVVRARMMTFSSVWTTGGAGSQLLPSVVLYSQMAWESRLVPAGAGQVEVVWARHSSAGIQTNRAARVNRIRPRTVVSSQIRSGR